MVNKGSLLISEPYLGDPNFERSVILICENNESGTVGFMLNRPSILTLDSVLFDIKSYKELLYVGGPVSQDSLHFIYRNKQKVEDSIEILENLYWGGNFEQLKELINEGEINPEDFRFFLGYSGWGEGQLQEELDKNSWIVSNATVGEIFETKSDELWRFLLKNMGGKYKMYSNYPIDPRLN